MTNQIKLSVLLAALATTAAMSRAQTAAPAAPAPAPAPSAAAPAEAPASPFTFDADVKWLNAYYSRGIDLQDNGLVLQPEVTVGYKAYKSGDVAVTPWLNLWGNVTDKRDDGETYTDMNYWDELDVTPGVDISVGRFTFSPQYIYYTSPAGNWSDVHEIALAISFDDSDINHLPIALNPYAMIYHEIVNRDHNNHDADDDVSGELRTYLELGLKPNWTPSKSIPLTLQFPIALGLGLDNQYFTRDGGNETLGFASIGVQAKYQLTDHWYFGPGVKWIHDFAYSAKQSHDNGNPDAGVVNLTVGCSY